MLPVNAQVVASYSLVGRQSSLRWQYQRHQKERERERERRDRDRERESEREQATSKNCRFGESLFLQVSFSKLSEVNMRKWPLAYCYLWAFKYVCAATNNDQRCGSLSEGSFNSLYCVSEQQRLWPMYPYADLAESLLVPFVIKMPFHLI